MTRAIEAQREGVAVAIARGDVAEERRRQDALDTLERRERSASNARQEAVQDAWRLYRETERIRGSTDWLAKLGMGRANVLTRAHIAAAQILRDHHIGADGMGGGEVRERVDGGNLHNGQMERLADSRRRGRYALNAACDAVKRTDTLPGVLMVILDGRSLRDAAITCGTSTGGDGTAMIREGVVEALDAAVAYLGIARG
jgi:hypothetical protein